MSKHQKSSFNNLREGEPSPSLETDVTRTLGSFLRLSPERKRLIGELISIVNDLGLSPENFTEDQLIKAMQESDKYREIGAKLKEALESKRSREEEGHENILSTVEDTRKALHLTITPSDSSPEILFKEIDDLELTMRLMNRLKKIGIKYIYELTHYPMSVYEMIDGFGVQTQNEMEVALDEIGLSIPKTSHEFELVKEMFDLKAIKIAMKQTDNSTIIFEILAKVREIRKSNSDANKKTIKKKIQEAFRDTALGIFLS